MIRRSLIIDKASTQSSWTRARDWIHSAAMWLVYVYLIKDALIELYGLGRDAIAWAFGGMRRPDLPISDLLGSLEIYGIVILANGAILIIWALYNQRRFRGSDRRRAATPVSVADLAELYRVPADDVADWQRARILVMRHAPDGTLTSVMSNDPAAEIPPARREIRA